MKLAKRLFALVLAVMIMAAMTVSFTAAASIPSGNCTLTINGLDGFTASVYKIADFNATTGAFSNFKSTDVATAVKAGFTGTTYTPDAALLTAAQALTSTELGAAVKTAAFTSSTTAITFNDIQPGVYYVKWTAWPTNRTKMQDSVLALPYYNAAGDNWVTTATITSKVATDTISYGKIFSKVGEEALDVVTRNIGDDVTYKLTGSVPGSAATPVCEFWFKDEMTKGLILKLTESKDDIAVKAFKALDTAGTALTAGTDYTKTVEADNKTFTINFNDTQIASLYTNEYKTIEITYTAKLQKDGVVIGGDGNPNTLTYHFRTVPSADAFEKTVTKKVKTYEFAVKKVDATTKEALNGATFKLYSADTCADTELLDTQVTAGDGANKGIAKFSGLDQGTYYVKETAAPDGYALNSKVFAVTIAADGAVTGTDVADSVLTVDDPKVILPNTGGTGTMLFTIAGIALIAGAAVLFIIYKKKASSK